MIGLTDQEAVIPVVWQRQASPSTGNDRSAPERTSYLDHHLADIRNNGVRTVESKVDGSLAGVEEGLQFNR